jgi:hypothetical protein
MEERITLTAHCFLCGHVIEVGTWPKQEALTIKEKHERPSDRVYLFKCEECLRALWGKHFETAQGAGFVHP